MRNTVLLLGLSGVLAVLTPVQAGNCGYSGYRSSYYYPKTYYYNTPGYGYSYPVQKVVAQELEVAPLFVTVPVESYAVPIQAYGVNHYYSVQENYQQRATLRDIIREELRAFQGGGTAAQQATTVAPRPTPTPTPVPSTPSYSTAPPKPTDLGVDNDTDPNVAAAVLAAFQSTGCLNCHMKQIKGNLRLAFDQNGTVKLALQNRDRRWLVYGYSSTGVMPPEAQNDASKAMKNDLLPGLLQWALAAKQ